MSLYNGFSTINRRNKFKLTDFELAKQDLYNHLNTKKGERIMHPNFGTIIWGMLFEPLNDETRNIIEQDLLSIIKFDPRLRADSIVVTDFEHGIQIEVDLTYVLDDQRDILRFTFDRNN